MVVESLETEITRLRAQVNTTEAEKKQMFVKLKAAETAKNRAETAKNRAEETLKTTTDQLHATIASNTNEISQLKVEIVQLRSRSQQPTATSTFTSSSNQPLIDKLESQLLAAQLQIAKFERRLEKQWQVAKEDVVISGTELGRGRFGVVKLGTYHGVEIAVKMVAENASKPQQQAAANMLRTEAKTLAKVHHPNIVVSPSPPLLFFIGLFDFFSLIVNEEDRGFM